MPIPIKCGQCGTGLRAPDTAVGKKVKCPKCGGVIPVPAAETGEKIDKPATKAAPPPTSVASRKPRDEERPSRRRGPDQDEERPTRRVRRRDDDDDDRLAPRSRDTSDDPEQPRGGGVQLGLGIAALAMGVIAIVFSIIPCCGSVVAWPVGGVGLLLGGIGVIVALTQKGHRVGFPIAGTVCSLVAIAITTTWYFVAMAWAKQTHDQLQSQVQQGFDRMDQMRKEQEEKEKERQEEEKKKQEAALEKLLKDPTFQAQRKQSQDNLRKLARAMLDYEKEKGNLPGSAWGAQPGFPGQWSWRVAILPYLGPKEKALYQQLKLENGPDHPDNRMVLQDKMPDVFRSPRHSGEKNRTFYQVFAGFDGPFAHNRQPKPADFHRGADNTILIAEAKDMKDWYRAGDIDFTSSFRLPALGGIFNDHFNAATAEGSVFFLSRATFSDDDLKKLIAVNGDALPANWPPPKE